MSKIILIDVDGTLVDYENNLPQSAVDAIKKARKMDIGFIYVLDAVKLKFMKLSGILD